MFGDHAVLPELRFPRLGALVRGDGEVEANGDQQ